MQNVVTSVSGDVLGQLHVASRAVKHSERQAENGDALISGHDVVQVGSRTMRGCVISSRMCLPMILAGGDAVGRAGA